jgi:hypothetical protein
MRDDKQLQGLRQKAYTEVLTLNRLQGDAQSFFGNMSRKQFQLPATEEQFEKLKALGEQWGKADEATRAFVTRAIVAGLGLQAWRRHRYEEFSKWSVFLYAFGAILAILGVLIESHQKSNRSRKHDLVDQLEAAG